MAETICSTFAARNVTQVNQEGEENVVYDHFVYNDASLLTAVAPGRSVRFQSRDNDNREGRRCGGTAAMDACKAQRCPNGGGGGLGASTPIAGIDGPVTQLIAGLGYACALRTDGAVFCWAEGNRPDAAAVALLRDTSVWCWGVVGGDHRSGSPKGSL